MKQVTKHTKGGMPLNMSRRTDPVILSNGIQQTWKED